MGMANGTVVAIGGCDHEQQGQIGPATQDGMHLVTEDMPFLSGRPTPGSIGILLIPGRQQTAVDDEVPSLNQAHLEQRGDQGDKDQEVGQ